MVYNECKQGVNMNCSGCHYYKPAPKGDPALDDFVCWKWSKCPYGSDGDDAEEEEDEV